MSSDWPIVKLGDIAEVVTKGTTPTSVGHKFIEKGINFIKVECLTANGDFIKNKFAFISDECNQDLKRSQLKEGDIIFSIAGALGRTAIVKKEVLPANTNQALSIIRLKPSTEYSTEFIYKALSTGFTLEQIEKHRGGVAQQNLSLAQVKSFEIPLPPFDVQQSIVAILDEAFAGIDTAIANTEKNLANARELFESYLNSVFTKRGEGWGEKLLGEMGKITSSKRIFKKEYVAAGVPFYRTKEIKELANNRKVTTELFIEQERYNEIRDKHGVPSGGDILMTAIGTIGEIYVVNPDDVFYFKDGNVLWLKDFADVEPNYLKYALMSFVDVFGRMSHGAAYNALPIEKLKNHLIPIPEKQVQKQIIDKLDALQVESNKLQAIYQQKLESLTELKQSLLQKAFSGELTAEGDKLMDEAVA